MVGERLGRFAAKLKDGIEDVVELVGKYMYPVAGRKLGIWLASKVLFVWVPLSVLTSSISSHP